MPPISTALPADDLGAPYDRRAAAYDWLVGNRLYNRLLWGTSPDAYRAFAAKAAADAQGPLLEVACGTAAFTAGAYAAAKREVTLVDRSRAMLERAAARIGEAPQVALLQADLFALPFAPHTFDTVLAMGLLHLLEDLPAAAAALAAQARGRVFVTSLVAETRVGARYLRMLHRAGEVVEPRTADAVVAGLAAGFGVRPRHHREGCMLFAVAEPAGSTCDRITTAAATWAHGRWERTGRP